MQVLCSFPRLSAWAWRPLHSGGEGPKLEEGSQVVSSENTAHPIWALFPHVAPGQKSPVVANLPLPPPPPQQSRLETL